MDQEDAHRHTVLLVEDDPDVREATATFLECSGFDVAVAGDGRDALGSLEGGLRPCLILLDLMMPRLSGFEFRRIQLADPKIAAIPVVVLSAAGDLARRTAHLTPDDVLAKPPDLSVLAALIERHCRRKHGDRAAG